MCFDDATGVAGEVADKAALLGKPCIVPIVTIVMKADPIWSSALVDEHARMMRVRVK